MISLFRTRVGSWKLGDGRWELRVEIKSWKNYWTA